MFNSYYKVNYRFSVDETSWSLAECIKTTLLKKLASHLGATLQHVYVYVYVCMLYTFIKTLNFSFTR